MRIPVALLLCCTLSGFAAAEDKPLPKKGEKGVVPSKENNYAGQWVATKKPMSEIRLGDWVDGKEVFSTPIDVYLVFVLEDHDGFLFVRDVFRDGWVNKEDFLLPFDAVKFWQDAASVKPTDTFARHMRGRVTASNSGQTEDALNDLSEAIRLEPKNAAYHCGRAWFWLMIRPDFDKAIADITEAIRLEPKNAAYHFRRGLAYAMKNQSDKVIADCSEAIRLEPKSALAYVNRSIGWLLEGDYDKAHADLDEAIRLDKNNSNALLNKGSACRFQKNYDHALIYLNQAIRIEPKNPGALSMRGRVWMEMKKYDQAIADCDAALKIHAMDSSAHVAKAITHSNMGNYTEAHMSFRDAVAYGSHHSILEETAWFYATCPKDIFRDGKKALEYLAKAKELNAKGISYWKPLAAAYAETGQFELAVAEQTKVVEKLKSAKKPDADDVKKAEAILELYKSKKPYRDVNE